MIADAVNLHTAAFQDQLNNQDNKISNNTANIVKLSELTQKHEETLQLHATLISNHEATISSIIENQKEIKTSQNQIQSTVNTGFSELAKTLLLVQQDISKINKK